jgi:hypothetical protein
MTAFPQLQNETHGPPLPAARGASSEQLLAALRKPVHSIDRLPTPSDREDFALSLYVLYELHYRGFAAVDSSWEWEPSLLANRTRLERRFEVELRYAVAPPTGDVDIVAELCALANRDGVSLSRWFTAEGTAFAIREFAIHRSAYQLKEADPHTWAIPRLQGRAKAALVEIQRGEYGDGDVAEMHSELFANTMQVLGLDASYGAYLDRIPGVTLQTVNLISLFGLHRRLRGALIGHLALFEMCSVGPMSRYAATLERLGFPDAMPFYEEHVRADREHAQIALHDMAAELAASEPDLAGDIVFGARALDYVELNFANHLLDAWKAGRSSLRRAC